MVQLLLDFDVYQLVLRDHHYPWESSMSRKLYTQTGNAAKRALELRPANDENGSLSEECRLML